MSETNNYRSSQKRWDAKHAEIVRASKAKYNEKKPVWSFRPTPEILEWLEEERWDENGKSETNASLIIRKLEKLRNLENQGY